MVASPPARILSSLGDRAASIGFFVKQDLIDRYRSDVLGVVWLFCSRSFTSPYSVRSSPP